MTNKMRYFIKGIHPESDSSWTEDGTWNTIQDAYDHMIALPEIDCGNGWYTIVDKETGEEIDYSIANIKTNKQ